MSWKTCIAASNAEQLGSRLFLLLGYLSWGSEGDEGGFCVLLAAAAFPAGKMGIFPEIEELDFVETLE